MCVPVCVGGVLEVFNSNTIQTSPEVFFIENYKPWKMFVTKREIGDTNLNKKFNRALIFGGL